MAPQRAGRDTTKQMLRHRQMVLDQMDFKQKAEEKKMSMSKNIARLAVTAGLTAALSFGGVMAPVTMAFAAESGNSNYVPTVTTTGNVIITEQTYTDTTFKGIQIFKATVTQDKADANGDGTAEGDWKANGDKTLSDIEWASDAVQNAVTGAFAGVDGAPDVNAGAQEWANYINDNKGNNVGKDAKVDAGSTLDKIAEALEKITTTNDITVWKTSTDGKFNNLPAGYWLFVTAQPGSTKDTNKINGNEDAYTSPIFTIVGGADVNAKPKKDVPNVTKAVKDDKDGTFGTDVFKNPNKAADSAMDQYVDYQLAGTVASNINTYRTYKYAFTDELPKSMTPMFTDETNSTTPAVTVKIDNEKVISGYTATFDGKNVLTVDFPNLKACKGENDADITVTDNSTVTVEYQAKLDSSKIFENGSIKDDFKDLIGKAQENKVKLTYSNNPHSEGSTGTTVDHPAYDYTYGIDVTKVGNDEDKAGNPKTLEGVQFTLQEQDSNDFIKADGTTTTDKDSALLTTNSEGKINVVGLDEGTYILKEVKPAPGYNNSAASGVTFTICRTLNQDGTDVTPDTTSAIVAGQDVVQANSAKAEVGKLSFTIVDQKGSGLPLTGLNGVTFTWIAGGAVLCIGVAHLIRSRKQVEESEQE